MGTDNTFFISGPDLWRWRQQAIAEAKTTPVDATEVDWLLLAVCQIDKLALRLGTLASQTQVLARFPLGEIEQLWQRRIVGRVPLQQLVGYTPWRQFTVHVSPAVLIPRPETELMIDLVVEAVAQSADPEKLRQGTWADLGTGSGAIALGLADVLPEAQILAVDVSPEALAVARQNAMENGLSDRIQFLQGSWFEPLLPWWGQLSGMISNPPYIPTATVPTLQPEVANHEPHLALDGGADGLTFVCHLVHTAPDFLQGEGVWLVELMQGQAPQVQAQLTQTDCYKNIQIASDLADVERFVLAQKR